MNCPECHSPMLANQLGCPSCAERKSMAELLERAKSYLPAVTSGERALTLRRPKSGRDSSVWHYQLVSKPNARTFCGLEVGTKWFRLVRYWDEIQRVAVCGSCSDAVARLTKEIEHAST